MDSLDFQLISWIIDVFIGARPVPMLRRSSFPVLPLNPEIQSLMMNNRQSSFDSDDEGDGKCRRVRIIRRFWIMVPNLGIIVLARVKEFGEVKIKKWKQNVHQLRWWLITTWPFYSVARYNVKINYILFNYDVNVEYMFPLPKNQKSMLISKL